ncbi:MAG: hypothetical protein L0922_03110 [Candidatus Mariimomonas ferrooxydans]
MPGMPGMPGMMPGMDRAEGIVKRAQRPVPSAEKIYIGLPVKEIQALNVDAPVMTPEPPM